MGRYEDAISSLVTAYISAREAGITHWGHCEFPQGFCLLDHLMLTSDRSSLNDRRHGVLADGEEFFIYSRPISIPRTLPVDYQETRAIVSISILFNLALAQHVYAIELCPHIHGSERQELTRRALKLYRLAFHLQYSHNEDVTAFGLLPRPSNMLLLALMNNSGHTYHMLGESEGSSACFQHLFSSLMWLRSTSWSQASIAASDDYCSDDILAEFSQSTATWLIKQLSKVAAPAA